MDRSPEKLFRSQAKLQNLDTNSNVQSTSHEDCNANATNPSRGQIRQFNSETMLEKNMTTVGSNTADKFLCRKSGYAVEGLPQCFQVPTPNAAMAMNLHSWPAMHSGFHTLDPGPQAAPGNLLYTYGGHHVMSNLVPVSSSARYDGGLSGKPVSARSDFEKQRSEREMARTESVIKTASERSEQIKTVLAEQKDEKPEQIAVDTSVHNSLPRYSTRELESKTDSGKEAHSFIESVPHGLSDAQLAQLKYQHKPSEISTFAPVNGSYRPHSAAPSRPEDSAKLHQTPYSLNEPRTAYSRCSNDSFKNYNYRTVDFSQQSATNASSSGSNASSHSARVQPSMHSRTLCSGSQSLTTSETERSRSPWKQTYSSPVNPENSKARSEAFYPVRFDQSRESRKLYAEGKSDDFQRKAKLSHGEDAKSERIHPARLEYGQRYPPDSENVCPRQHYSYSSSSPVSPLLPSRSNSETTGHARSQNPRDILTDKSHNSSFDLREIPRDARNIPREMLPSAAPESSRSAKELVSDNTNLGVKRTVDQPERPISTKLGSNAVSKSQGSNKNEKPVVPESMRRYKLGSGEGKRCSKSDKVIVYDKEQGMSIGLSVRENSNQNSFEYFNNGRPTSWDVRMDNQKDKTSAASTQGGSDITGKRDSHYGSSASYRQNREIKDEKAEKILHEKADSHTGVRSKERGNVGEFYRQEKRSVIEPKPPPFSSRDFNKTSDDKNNNSASTAYRYGNGFYGNVSLPNGEIGRYVPRISSTQERDFRPPNATLEMYERREQELERIGYRKLENVSLPTQQDIQNAKKTRENKDEKGLVSSRKESNGRPETLRIPYERTKDKTAESCSSEEDETQIVPKKNDRHLNASSQPSRTSYRPPTSVNQESMLRTSSPVVERERSGGGSIPMSAYNSSLYSNKRPGSENDISSRDVRCEELLMTDPNLWRTGMDGKSYQQLMEYYMYNAQMMGIPPMHLMTPVSPIMLFPDAGQYIAVNPMDMVDPRLWSLQEAASRDPRMQQHLQYLQQWQMQQLQMQQSKNPFWAHAQQGGHTPWFPFPYYKHFETLKKDEREDRKPAEEEKHQKMQERVEKLDRKDNPNSNEATPTSMGSGENSVPRLEESQKTADIEILRSEVNGHGEEAPQKVDRHQFLDKQERKRLPQKPLTADSRQSPDKPGFQEQFEKVQKFQQDLVEKSQFPQPVSPPALPKRDASSTSLLTVSTSGGMAPPAHTDSYSVSPTTASAAMTLSNLEKNSRSGEVPVANKNIDDRVYCDVEKRSTIETRGLATANESTREGSDSLRGDVAAGEKIERNVAEGNTRRRECSTFASGMMALGRVAAERSLIEETEHQKRDSDAKHLDIKLERAESFDQNQFESDEEDQDLETIYSVSPEDLNDDEKLSNFVRYQEMKKQTAFSIPNAESLNVWKQLNDIPDVLSHFKLEKSNYGETERSDFNGIKEKLTKNRTFKEERVYETKYEYKSFATVMLPCRKDMFFAEKENILKQEKIEAERRKIRENINRCRLLAKRRSSKERFTVLSHRRDTRSPTTILNAVTSSISDMIENNTEKEMRMKLAELQKRYRERVRELSRLQPKYRDGNEDGSGKNQPKRGPGRPRKRKYFGGGTKYSARPSSVASNGSDFSASTFEEPFNGTQGLNLWGADSDESLHSKDAEPVKKKKKKMKTQKKDLSPPKVSTPRHKENEETPVKVKLTKKVATGINKAGFTTLGKRDTSVTSSAMNDNGSGSEQEALPSLYDIDTKKSKTRKEKKIKKNRQSKTDLELSSKKHPPDSANPFGETKEQKSSVKLKKTKKIKKKKKKLSALFVPDSSENDFKTEMRHAQIGKVGVETLVAKETDIMDTEVPIIRYKNPDDLSDEGENDEVFETNQDEEDGLNLLAAFAAEVKPAKRQRERPDTPSSDHSAITPSKKRGRPKKPNRPSSESEVPMTPKKRIRKPSTKKAASPVPVRVVSPPTVHSVRPSLTEAKIPIPLPEVEDISEPESETKPEPEVEKDENVEEQNQSDEKVGESGELSQETTKKGRTKSAADTLKDTESSFPLLADELWQRRRSERIFLNSSSVDSPSPLSSPSAGFHFGPVIKKPKKSSKSKKEKSVSLSSVPSENEVPETLSDASKQHKSKPKRRKSLGSKGKKKRKIVSAASVESDQEGDQLAEADKEEDTTRGNDVISEAETEVDHSLLPLQDCASKSEQEEVFTESDPSKTGFPLKVLKDNVEQKCSNETAETDLAEKVTSGDEQNKEESMVARATGTENKMESAKKETGDEFKEKEDNEFPESVVSSLENQKNTNKEKFEPREENDTLTISGDEKSDPGPEQVFTFTGEELVQGTKVILPADGVFFRGFISIIQEPDLYGVVLAGERGRRPHWRATDQLLTQAVKDVVPTGKEVLAVGTRVCAHWSPQYRCFYPGTVTGAPEDEKEQSDKVWIEFDDGDSGIFPFCEVRRILSGRPVEDAESSPVVAAVETKKRTRTSYNSIRLDTKQDCHGSESNSCSDYSADEDTKPTKTRAKQNNNRQSKKCETLSSSEVNDDERKTQDVVESDSESEKTDVSKKDVFKSRKPVKTGQSCEHISNKDTKLDSENNSVTTARHSRRKLEKSAKNLERLNRKRRTLKERSKLTSSCNDSSDPVDESTSDGENAVDNKLVRGKDSVKYSDLDLRKKSLTLSLCSSTRSGAFNSRGSGSESPRAEPEDDSESFSDAFDDSPLVENKQFQPRLPRRRRSELDRLQMDLKSSGQLWQWSGRSSQKKRRGKGRKVFYKAISRADETICVGDSAVFMSSPYKSNNLPYVGKIESMWEGCNGSMIVKVKWFYHPEETKKGRRPADAKAALYLSSHVDENDIQTISHRCEVLNQDEYKRRMQSLENANTRSSSRTDRLFCCIGKYDPTSECFQTD